MAESHRFTPASNARKNIRPSANSSAASPFSPGPFLGRRHGALRFGGVDARFPRVDRLGFPPLRRRFVRTAEPGPPAERESTGDQLPTPPYRPVPTRLQIRPSQLLLPLPVALLHPVAQSIQPHHLRQIRRRHRPLSFLGEPGRGRLVARYHLLTSGSVAGSVVATTNRVGLSGP